MKMYDTPQPVGDYLGRELECACGRTHSADIKAVCIESGALAKLPTYVEQFGYKKPYILCDEITYKIAGKRCKELLDEQGIPSVVHILSHMGFDEATLGEIVVSIPHDADLMIGVGTGSITDMIRYSSYKLNKPCFTVATGAPMDGFAASIGIMNVNKLKATMQAHSTEVIIGDTDILSSAPLRMTVAGFGDLIGKISCLNDWELGRIINGEHYCENIVTLVKECVNNILCESERIHQRDSEALGKVMEGLVLTGVSISLYGNSRPASGAEHHMSHYWETIGEQQGKSYAMHGEQVAVGTVLTLMLIEELIKAKIDFEYARRYTLSYDNEKWEADIRRAYGEAAESVIAMEKHAGKNNIEARLRRIDSMEKHWSEIIEQLRTLPDAESLISILRTAGSPCLPADIGIDDALLKDTFMFSKEVRERYTVMQTAYDLGLMEELSNKLIERARRLSECSSN